MPRSGWAVLVVVALGGGWWLSRGVPAVEPTVPRAEPAAVPVPILIGEVGSLTGPEAEFGISTRNGVELAIAEANASGGVKGRPLALRVYDDQSLPAGAARATRRLVRDDHVVVVIGEAASASSLAMAPIAQDAGVPMITPASTNPAVTAQGDFIFRACFSDAFQGLVMAKYARQELHLARVAVLVESHSVYSEGLAAEFAARFAQLGGEVVATGQYAKGDTDFRAQLEVISTKRAEAIYVPGYVREVVAIAQQSRQRGLQATLLGADGWDSEKLFETGGGWIEGSFLTNHYSADDPSVAGFVRAYKEAFGFVPDARAALGYDAARLAVDAMRRAADLSGAALRDALAETKEFAAVTGRLSIDSQRNAVKPAVVLAVENGRYRFIRSEPPSP